MLECCKRTYVFYLGILTDKLEKIAYWPKLFLNFFKIFDFTWSLMHVFQCLFIFESHFFLKFLVSDLKEEHCFQNEAEYSSIL